MLVLAHSLKNLTEGRLTQKYSIIIMGLAWI